MLGQLSFWTKNYFVFKMADKMFWPLTNIFPHWKIPCLQNKSQIALMVICWWTDMLAIAFYSTLLWGYTSSYSFKRGQDWDLNPTFP